MARSAAWASLRRDKGESRWVWAETIRVWRAAGKAEVCWGKGWKFWNAWRSVKLCADGNHRSRFSVFCIGSYVAHTGDSEVLTFWLQPICVFSYNESLPNLAWFYALLDCSGGHWIICGIYQNQADSIWSLWALSAAPTSPARTGAEQVWAKRAKVFVVDVVVVIVTWWKGGNTLRA